jgi:DNA-binding NtrC family response regulator
VSRFKLLLIDDDPLVHETARSEFSDTDIILVHANNGHEGIDIFKKQPFEFPVILLDYSMPDLLGSEVLTKIREINDKQFVVIYSADNSREALKDTFKAGAVDFIEKNLDSNVKLERLNELYQKWLKLYAITTPQTDKIGYRHLINSIGLEGQSKSLFDIGQKVISLADTDSTVLIKGPSGTGKSDIAKAIQKTSRRKDLPFSTVNCGAITENLIESELFGHVKGAFTGATSSKVGMFEKCNKGTLFLDEIGELPLNMQVKLLRAIQDQVIRPVGSNKEIKIDVRLIAATNKELDKEVLKGSFREDLYYRLNVIEINMQSLADRPDDIPLLVQKFIKDYAGDSMKITESAMNVLQKYSWPGNVRELKNEIEKICVFQKDNLIKEESISPKIFVAKSKKVPEYTFQSIDEVKNKQNEIEKIYWLEAAQELQNIPVSKRMVLLAKNNNMSKATLYRRFGELGISLSKRKGEVHA